MGPKFRMLRSTKGMNGVINGTQGRAITGITFTGTMGTISASRANTSSVKLTNWSHNYSVNNDTKYA
jgi:hypothetical protein